MAKKATFPTNLMALHILGPERKHTFTSRPDLAAKDDDISVAQLISV